MNLIFVDIEALEWMIGLSIYSYYDVIRVLYGIADFGVLVLWGILGLIAAIMFFIVILKFRFKKIDMI